MRDLSALAEQIRTVRDAQRHFIGCWRLEQAIIGHEVLDHLADEMAAAHRELEGCGSEQTMTAEVKKPQPRSWDGWGWSRSWSMYRDGGNDGES